jgi:hypothetical protein
LAAFFPVAAFLPATFFGAAFFPPAGFLAAVFLAGAFLPAAGFLAAGAFLATFLVAAGFLALDDDLALVAAFGMILSSKEISKINSKSWPPKIILKKTGSSI